MGHRFWSFKAAADGKSADLLLYGLISNVSWWGDEVTPKQFKQELDTLGSVSEIRVFINSDGGDVFAGQAIHSMLSRHPASITVYVDGLAASIASVVAMAGDKVIMPRNAMMMVHNPITIAMGDAEEFRKVADTLDQVRESIVAAYQGKTGMARDELIPLLEAETWMTAEEAVALGFADEMEEAKQIAASLASPGHVVVNGVEMDISRYQNAPPAARLFGGVSGNEKPTKRQIETALRDAGLSARDARALIADGWKALDGVRDEPPGERVEAAVQSDADKAAIEYERLRAILHGMPA